MGNYLYFIPKSALGPDGEPLANTGNAWLQTHVKTSSICQLEDKAAAMGLQYCYPANGTKARVMQLVVFAKYLQLLNDLWPVDQYGDFWHEAKSMADFVALHGNEIEQGEWYWHQG